MARFFPILRAAVLANIDCQNVRELVAFAADGHAGHSTDTREIRKARKSCTMQRMSTIEIPK